jgi:hypothetical protein
LDNLDWANGNDSWMGSSFLDCYAINEQPQAKDCLKSSFYI